MDETGKLNGLRQAMAAQGLAGYLQPVHDEYRNEYPPACNRRVEWLTGFAGSAGMVAVTAHKAALFVDGRYTLQAKNEVDSSLYEIHNSADLTPDDWLAASLAPGERVGYDPMLYTSGMVKRLEKPLAAKSLEAIPCPNLVDGIWQGRPAAPASVPFIHDIAHAGESTASKLRRIAADIEKAGADAAILAMPDSVCWLLNIRGHDIEQTPLLLCPAILDSAGNAQLFIAPERCGGDLKAHLGEHVALRGAASLEEALQALAHKRVMCDPQSTPVWFIQRLSHAGATIIEADDPCLLPKAMKNPVELQGIRNAHIRDGVAVSRLLCWLDHQIASGQTITEQEVCDQLLAFRAGHPLFTEPSFSTISGSGPNGAIVHYRVSPKSNRTLRKGELFLLDSGGQYPDGTTDITRTVAIGEPSSEHKDRFTRVLKGHIALAMAVFPEGTGGTQLDALARQFLWQAGLDYDHGTGHGVGFFLNVHEGPQRIGKRGGDAPLRPGMLTSNEPGYYKAGEYGIRIENLVITVEKAKTENGKMRLAFETVTCVPIDRRLIDPARLTQPEKEWLNQYHSWVFSQLANSLGEHERVWLEQACFPLP